MRRPVVVLVVLGAAIAAVVAWPRAHRAPSRRTPETADAPRPRRAPAPAPVPDRSPLAPLTPQGPTRFVRRLEVGRELAALRADVEAVGADAARLRERLERVAPFLLHADLPRRPEPDARTLTLLTEPPRDLQSFRLDGASDADPLGAALRVRVWGQRGGYEDDEIARASTLLDHIARCVGRDLEHGVDVLVTPGMGEDVFPFQGRVPLPRVAGIYSIGDRYCAVRAGLRREFAFEVLKHELIHAYCWQAARGLTSSRFLAEGLAEYLRLVTPADNGLNVPAERLADSLAELSLVLARLTRRGVDFGAVAPRRLVRLTPAAFYGLGHLGYLVAQATIAFLGGDLVQLSLFRGTDEPLVHAIEAMEWADLRAFVDKTARGGRVARAIVVADGEPTDTERAPFADALEAIGARCDRPPVPVSGALDQVTALADPKRRGEVLRRLSGARGDLRVFADASAAMDREIQVSWPPSAFASALDFKHWEGTARELAIRLAEHFGAASAEHVVALADPVQVGGADVLQAVRPLALDRLLGRPSAERSLAVLIVGSAGVGLDAPEEGPVPGSDGEVLLVVDVTPDGQAIEWAAAFDVPGRLVAYWDPFAPPLR